MIVAYSIAQFNIWAMIASAFIRLWSKPIFPLSILKTDIFCTSCGTRALQFYVGFFVAKLQKSKRIFYCISPENVSSMKPVAPIVFRYCTSELAHAAAPPSRFEPAALGCGLVLFGCIFCVKHTQSNCLICLPDKSGNFLAFGARTRKNTVKSEKTGFGMAIIARPRPVFCVFGPKISRTFWGKCTEQSSRKKLAEGGFEPRNAWMVGEKSTNGAELAR